ncbi:VanW family protein [Herbivorax sp. ANBcel31]|uniref:VanW family protein n=1 Tax=Herbivorax sp. ANBcel31 TaxID=3069754 RepID=UPI0027B1E7D8|nr:VanW family protein [Herbivorax sp. ANBcel31]MDQ2085991.1 VanW family protein [Herbivorax sp. ANBcel31]
MLLKFLLKKKINIIFITLLLVCLALFFGLFSILNQKTFYKGVSIEGIDVSGLDIDIARELVEKKLYNYTNEKKIKLRYEDKVWEISLNDISYGFLLENTLIKGYRVGREGGVFTRVKELINLRLNGKDIFADATFSNDELLEMVLDVKDQIDRKEKNATAEYKSGRIKYSNEIIGEYMDVDKNIDLIENSILRRNFSTIDLNVKKVIPKVQLEDISHIEEVVASFSTSFNSYKINRTYNIKLACERINNSIILPDQVFSVDRALGTRTKENGYKNAPVIINNKFIEGVGGGVCQVTSTLYVAALKAKLGIVERASHSMPLGYVEPGQDATIAEGYIDFKFKNNKDYAILLNAEVVGGKIIVRFIGKKSPFKYNVALKSIILERISPGNSEVVYDWSLSQGETVVEKRPLEGLRVAVYRETYDDKYKLLEREKISEDYYRPVKGRIRIGHIRQ